MMLRFSKFIQGILEELDDKSLTDSKIASKSLKIKSFHLSENGRIQKIVIRTPFEIVKELAIAVH